MCLPKRYASSLRSANEGLRRELAAEKARVCIGGDVFETQRNRLILNQTIELEYLRRAEAAESSLLEARKEVDRLSRQVKSAAHVIAIAKKSNKNPFSVDLHGTINAYESAYGSLVAPSVGTDSAKV